MPANWCMAHAELDERRAAMSAKTLLCSACYQVWKKAGKPEDEEGAPADGWIDERVAFLKAKRAGDADGEATDRNDKEPEGSAADGATDEGDDEADEDGDEWDEDLSLAVELRRESPVDAEILSLLEVLAEREFRPVDWEAKWILAQALRARPDYAALREEAGLEPEEEERDG